VCSGCSGDYSGDFEDPGEPNDDPDNGDQKFARAPWACGGPEGNGNTLDGRGCEAPACEAGKPQLATPPAAGNGSSGEEIYEIMVSATRIVEIRVITANSHQISELREGQPGANVRADQRSRAASAKYYQTRCEVAEDSGDRVEARIFSGFAAYVLGTFKKWSRWASNVGGKPCFKEFH
jgi:hypothetical protein